MTVEKTKRLLEDCLKYSYNIESLKMELKTVNDVKMKNKINSDIDSLTEKVMNVRCKIDEIQGANVRLVMRMRYINLMPFKDIAEKLNVTYQWVNKLYNDGIEHLSKLL